MSQRLESQPPSLRGTRRSTRIANQMAGPPESLEFWIDKPSIVRVSASLDENSEFKEFHVNPTSASIQISHSKYDLGSFVCQQPNGSFKNTASYELPTDDAGTYWVQWQEEGTTQEWQPTTTDDLRNPTRLRPVNQGQDFTLNLYPVQDLPSRSVQEPFKVTVKSHVEGCDDFLLSEFEIKEPGSGVNVWKEGDDVQTRVFEGRETFGDGSNENCDIEMPYDQKEILRLSPPGAVSSIIVETQPLNATTDGDGNTLSSGNGRFELTSGQRMSFQYNSTAQQWSRG